MSPLPIAAQLYTARDQMAQDPLGTLRAVAALGYDGVEFAGLYNQPVAELRALLGELGLRVCSSHVPLKELEGNLDQTIETYRALGCPILVVPWLDASRRDEYAALAGTLAGIAERVRAAGLRLAYHNHDFELASQGGSTGLATLRDSTDPALVQFELDCGWVHKAGGDVLATMGEFRGRLPLLHIKDVDAQGAWAEVGNGVIDYAPVVAAAAEHGAEWLIVEQDVCARPPLESLAISLRWMRAHVG